MKINIKIMYIILSILFCNIYFTPLAFSDSTDETVSDISKELMCPVCRGQTVAESNSDLANDFRDIIRNKLKEGQSREQILNYFTARYGDSVLASPPARGFRLLIWFLPLAVIISGFIFLTRFLKHSVTKPVSKNVNKNDEYLNEVDRELKELD